MKNTHETETQMKGTKVIAIAEIKSGFEPFQEIIEIGTAGTIERSGKTFNGFTFVVRFEGYRAPATCARNEIEATG